MTSTSFASTADEQEQIASLVQLAPDSRVTDRLLQDGWGTSVGLFLGTSLTPEALSHHLRHFLFVTLPNGKRAYFRFYDPRVMRAFLPPCTGEQLDEFLRDLEARTPLNIGQ